MSNRLEHRAKLSVVFLLELSELSGQLALLYERRPQAHERANDLNARADGGGAVENRREHDGAVLGEGKRRVCSMTTASTI